jgi:hypothetical protein
MRSHDRERPIEQVAIGRDCRLSPMNGRSSALTKRHLQDSDGPYAAVHGVGVTEGPNALPADRILEYLPRESQPSRNGTLQHLRGHQSTERISISAS